MAPPPNWDDDFDFDDIGDIPKNKKVNNKKNKPNHDDDFFEDEAPADKLPAIASRNSVAKIKPETRSSAAKKNPYSEHMNLKGNLNIYDNDEFEEEIAEESPKKPAPANNPNNRNAASTRKKIEDEIEFEEEIADSPKKTNKNKVEPVQQSKKSEPEEEENYEEEFEEDYGEDFEEEIVEPPKKTETPALKTEPQQQKKLAPQPPRPQSKKQNPTNEAPKRNQTLAVQERKNPLIARVPSRHSTKSVSASKPAKNPSVANRSRVSTNKMSNSTFIPNKYENEIEKQFPNVDLNDLNQEKLSKLNDKIRAMIKRFNEELNDLINKNMLLLKTKKNEKSSTLEEKIHVLEEQKKNNDTMIEYMEREYEKLTGREGELREEEYQLMTEKKIEEAKDKIKEIHKLITKLKYEVKNEGNKLTRNSQDKKMAQQLHHLKTNLIQAKKDEEKQIERIEKLEEQSSNLNEKITDIEYQISELVDQAREKGIKLENREELLKKFEEIKKKLEANRGHRTKLEHLLKSKSDIIAHEKEQLKIGIKNCDMEIKNLYGSIEHTHEESVKVVEKAKMNPKIGANLAAELEAILQSLEVSVPDNYSVRSESNKSRGNNRPLKNVNAEIGNMEKSEPLRKHQVSNIPKNNSPLMSAQGEDNEVNGISKPSLFKKKVDAVGENAMYQEEKKNEVYERVWKEEDAGKKKNEPVPVPEEDKKKPFSLKRNRLSGDKKIPGAGEEAAKAEIGAAQENLKLEIIEEKVPEEEKKEEKPSLAGPKMMKFKKRGNNDDSGTNLKVIDDPARPIENPPERHEHIEAPGKEEAREEEAKPFVPKRFNLRRNQEKKDEEPSYLPSAEVKKEEPKREEPKREEPKREEPKREEPKREEQYRPKFDFGGVEDPFARNPGQKDQDRKNGNSYDPFAKKEEHRDKLAPSLESKEEPEVKPRFNLRLRDRNKQEEGEQSAYMPAAPKKDEPIQENLSNPYAPKNAEQKEPVISNPSNPYAQQGNSEAPARRREGPLKKPKIQQNAPKQKLNIYEQAEEPEGLNQFVKESSPPKHMPAAQEKEPNLDDILGLKRNKNKGDEDFSDLVGAKADRRAKKKNDFFADMDM